MRVGDFNELVKIRQNVDQNESLNKGEKENLIQSEDVVEIGNAPTNISDYPKILKNKNGNADSEAAKDAYSLKPDNVIMSEDSPPIFQYFIEKPNVYLAKNVILIDKPQDEQTEEEIKAYFKDLREFAEERMEHFTREDYLKEEKNGDLTNFTAPVIHNRYKDRSDMTIVELGPVYTTAVPEALKDHNNRYVSLEIARPFIEKQREFLLADPVLAEQTSELEGDLRSMPFKPNSADVIITSCCGPFQCKDKKESIDQMADILKPGGEFIIFPDDFINDLGDSKEYFFQRFDLVETHSQITKYANDEETRNLAVLRKKGE